MRKAGERAKEIIGTAKMQRGSSEGGTKGTLTAAATRHNMGPQEFARHVLAHKDEFSPKMVKKANFARNASKWNN